MPLPLPVIGKLLWRYKAYVGIVAALALGFVGGWKVNGWRHDSQELVAYQAAEKAGKAAASAAVKAIEGIEVRNVTIRQKAETVIREVPVYRECVHDQRVFDGINQALTEPGANPAGLPGVDSTD